MTPKAYTGPLLFGAAYYPSTSLDQRLERDLDLMVEAGINIIRVGESVWSTWEPRDGEFDLDWLDPVLDAAHERGISRDHRHTDVCGAAMVAPHIPGDHRADRDGRGEAVRHAAGRRLLASRRSGFLAERLIRKIVSGS